MEKSNVFNFDDILDFDGNVIESGVREASLFLANQYEFIKETRQYAAMILGLFSAVFASLAGVLVGTLEVASAMTRVILISGMVANGVPIGILIRGLFYKRLVQNAGAQPSAYYSPGAVQWVRNNKGSNPNGYEPDKYFKVLHLMSLQLRIDENRKIQKSLVRWYRMALYCAVAAYSAVVVVIVIAAVIGV